jgi:crotonobetainyl-CoA:carnitine CoA-transferase CaiB-like acyl-CoA transferase
LATDQRFVNPAARSDNREAMYAILDEIFAGDTRANWAERLRALPVGPVLSVGEAIEGAAVAARGDWCARWRIHRGRHGSYPPSTDSRTRPSAMTAARRFWVSTRQMC